MRTARNLLTIAVFGFSILQSGVAISQTDGLIGHWTFDEGAGTTAYDSTNGCDGIIYGAKWTTGQLGSALWFDGFNDFVTVSSEEHFDFERTNSFSIFLWVKSDDFSRNCAVLAKEPDSGSFNGYELRMGYTRVRAILRNHWRYPENLIVVDSENSLINGQWYHIGFTYDGSSRASGVKVYINGIQETPSVVSDNLSGSILNNLPVTIGARTGGEYFNGIIDDGRIYDKALSDDEIWQLYNMQQRVAVDIRPGSCPNPLNLSSRGVLPVAILGSQELDVNTIDVASIRLEGIAPMRSGYEDVAAPVAGGDECDCTAEGPDGYTDLMLKFQTPAIVAGLLDEYPDLAKNDVVVLTLTGELADQTPIEGEDCIVIKGKYHSR